MTAAGWTLLALGALGALYSLYIGLHYYRHRDRRRADRRASPRDSAPGGENRRSASDRRSKSGVES